MNQLLKIFAEIIPEKINWDYVSKNYELSEAFIEQFSTYLNWDKISKYQTLSEDFIVKHLDKMNWKFIAYKQVLSENFILKHKDKLLPHKQSLTYGQKLSAEFIERNFPLIEIKELYSHYYLENLPYDFFVRNLKQLPKKLIQYKIVHAGISPDPMMLHYLGKDMVFNYRKIPNVDFIRNNLDRVAWQFISSTKEIGGKFTEEFILEFRDKIRWSSLSSKIKLSGEAARILINSGYGGSIRLDQDIGKDFLKKNTDKIDWNNYAFNNPYINEEIVNELKDFIPLQHLIKCLTRENFSLDFVRKHKDKLRWRPLTWNYFDKISEEESLEFKDYLLWEILLRKEPNYDFIIKHMDKIPPRGLILRHINTFSLEEIDTLKDHINWSNFDTYYNITDEIIDQFSDYVNWKIVLKRVKFSQHILEKHWNKMNWSIIANGKIDFSHLDFTKVINDVIQNSTFSRFPFLIYYNHRKFPSF